MGTTFFLIFSLATKFIGMIAQNSALNKQSKAAAEQARRDNEELDRQREEATEIAQEKKSDRVREADRETASMVAMLADVGGGGTLNESRFAGEVGFNSGVDLARIEGNRQRELQSLRSQQVGNRQNAINIASENRSKALGNTINFIGGAASTLGKAGVFDTAPTSAILTGSRGAALSGGGTVGSGRIVGGV